MRTRGYRAHRAPGIPCALNSERAGINEHLAKKAFGEIAKPCPRMASCLKIESVSFVAREYAIHKSSSRP
jgi:hypothetical protein